MSTVECITALFYEVDERLQASPDIPRPASGPVRWSPWGCCMRSKVAGIGPFIAGSCATIGRCFPASLSGPGSFVLHDPSGLDAGLLGLSDGARGH